MTTTKKLMDKKQLANLEIKCLILHYPEEICKAASKYTYPEELQFLILNDYRNKFIRNLALSLRENTLVLYQFVEKHGKRLFRDISDNSTSKDNKDRKIVIVHGKVATEERELIRAMMEKETNAIGVTSYGTFSTGINIRNLFNIVFASPYKSRIRNLQSIGRSLRPVEGKTATLFDVVDDLRYKNHENFALRHFKERMRIYMGEKFKYKIYHVNLY